MDQELCQASGSRIVCSECLLDGQHRQHKYKKLDEILQKLEASSAYLQNDCQTKLANRIKDCFEQIRRSILSSLDAYQAYFLK